MRALFPLASREVPATFELESILDSLEAFLRATS